VQIAAGESTPDLLARVADVPQDSWGDVRAQTLELLAKVKGEPAAELVGLLAVRGDLDRALADTTSRRAVHRGRAAVLRASRGRHSAGTGR